MKRLSTGAEAIARGAAGDTVVVLVGGDAGIGKSRLVAEAAAAARAQGALVLEGGCVSLGNGEGLPFAPIVEALRPTRDLSHNPLFQVSFALQNAPQEAVAVGGIQMSAVETARATARFDLEFHLWEREQGLNGFIIYSTELFEAGGATYLLLLKESGAGGDFSSAESALGEAESWCEKEVAIHGFSDPHPDGKIPTPYLLSPRRRTDGQSRVR